MKSHMFVKKLNKSGNYRSKIDFDKVFACRDNPDGMFKMVVQPIRNSEGKREIRYIKAEGGYIVSGEGYIITDPSKELIDKCIKRYHSERWKSLIQTEVENESELW